MSRINSIYKNSQKRLVFLGRIHNSSIAGGGAYYFHQTNLSQPRLLTFRCPLIGQGQQDQTFSHHWMSTLHKPDVTRENGQLFYCNQHVYWKLRIKFFFPILEIAVDYTGILRIELLECNLKFLTNFSAGLEIPITGLQEVVQDLKLPILNCTFSQYLGAP